MFAEALLFFFVRKPYAACLVELISLGLFFQVSVIERLR